MATRAATAEGSRADQAITMRPFAPSWLDAIVAGIERLPGPTWAAYVVLAAAFVGYVALEAAISSRGLFGQDPAYFAYGLLQVAPLVAYHYLSRGAASALDVFRPATDFDDTTAQRLRAELSTTPARPAVAVYVVGAVGYLGLMVAFSAGLDLVGQPPAFVAMRSLSEAFFFFPIILMTTYLLFRQIRIVSKLHISVVRVDLLQPRPLHAMSMVTGRGAIVVLIASLLAAPLPYVSAEARFALFALNIPLIVLAVTAFFVPLRGISRLLLSEKRRRLGEVSARIDATIGTLHAVVDGETSDQRPADDSRLAQVRIDALNKALASLLQEREFINKLSTWPWDPQTLRAVISAVALPILLFLITTTIDRLVR